MKNVKKYFCALLMLFMLGIAFNVQPSPALTSSTVKTELKEDYKVDDAEYTVALFSKPKIGNSFGVISENIALLGGVSLVVNLFKRDPLLTTICLAVIGTWFVTGDHEISIGVFAIIPALKVDTTGLAEDSDEKKFLESIGKRIKIDGGEGVSKKEMDDAIKVLGEELKGFKTLDVAKLTEILDEKKGVMASIIKMGLEVTKIQQKGVEVGKKDWRKMISDQFTDDEKLKALSKVVDGGGGFAHIFGNPEKFEDGVGVVQKVVGTILTSAVTTDSGGNALLDLMSVDDFRSINLQEPFIESFASVRRVSKPVYAYADYEPKEGGAAFTAENAPKSQLDLKVIVKTVGPKKTTAYSTLSTESMEDIPRMQSEATNFLLRKVMLKRQAGVLFGVGAGNDPIGVAGKARTYNQAGLLDNNGNALAPSLILQANGNGIAAPNLFDVIQACALQIFQTANYTDEMEYYPNLVILNPVDLASLKLKKNQFGQYLFPELLFNQGTNPVRIGNLNVIAKRQITPGKIMIGDFTRLDIVNYIDYAVRVGWINDNLINNLTTMVGETRFFTVLRELDRNAFIYDDIGAITNVIGA